MKKILSVLALSMMGSLSIPAFAQSAQEVQTLNSYGNYSYNQVQQSPVTRAQVRQELVDLEKAGYNPGRANDPYYPQNIQKYEQIVWEKHHQQLQNQQ